MKFKFTFFGLIISLFTTAQINYAFTTASIAFAANAAPTVLHVASIDDGISASTPIGFNFCYGGIVYTTFQASTNGVMFLGTTAAGSNLSNNLNTSFDRPAIAPLWDDLKTSTTGNVNYKLTGVSPNRVLTIEWLNMLWNYVAAGPVITFQVKLYETTNIVDFRYLQNGTAVNAGSASIGLGGQTPGDYYSLDGTGAAPTASKLIETNTLTTKPANNQVYIWTPSNCAGAPAGGTALASPSFSCVTYNTNLSLSGSTSACGITYQWQSAPAAAGPWTNITGATAPTTIVSVSSTTFYRCVLSCGASTGTSSAVTASLSAAGACGLCGISSIASLPFSLVGQTTCGQGNDVTSVNVTNVCGSTLYYGGEDVVYSFTPALSGLININVTSTGSFMGIMLYNGCPVSGGTCIGNAQSSAGNQTLCVNVTLGQTYYLVIDSWPAPACNPFDVSISAPGPCSGSIAGATAVASPTFACGTLTTNLSLTGVNPCGATYQWQYSTAIGGPYTNIVGATTSTYLATTTVSVYYQNLLTCGASTAVSSVVQTSVNPTPTVACSLSTYTAAAITYSFEVFVGTTLPTTDDILFNTIVNFGFPVCFGGSQYWGGYVASNGAFVFDGVPCYPNILTSTYAAGGVGTGYTIPNPAPVVGTSIPRNAILAPWQDINPALGGVMRYYTTGVAPNRKFVVSYESIPMFSCGTSSPSIYYTGQIKLYETSNIIEIHVGNKGVCPTFNNGEAVMGLHSYDGTIYRPPVNATMHNAVGGVGPYNQWTMTNTAYRFQSPCASSSGPCSTLPLNFKNFHGENISSLNKLTWETSEENNMTEFIIERSTDGINFLTISRQLPNNKPSNYTFNDNTYKSNVINYYRVTGIDNKGEYKSTFVIPIEGNYDNLTVSEIYPNPAKDKFSINFNSKTENSFTLKIKDLYGREIKTSQHLVNVGISQVYVSCNEFSAGVYIVEVLDNFSKVISQQKLIVAN
ncbi:MAG: T9SS type A sorting domain-containing protein [Bacteroidetes bacterium]|nr:T9SS type A sorting domain-containing protein [Bacteroidota bacterium]